jgi:hypothetical protein
VTLSNTRTSLLRDTLTNANCPAGPAKTTSAGSSLTLIVSTTMPAGTETMLMLSES